MNTAPTVAVLLAEWYPCRQHRREEPWQLGSTTRYAASGPRNGGAASDNFRYKTSESFRLRLIIALQAIDSNHERPALIQRRPFSLISIE